jgi:hypothetical protein
MSVAAVPMSDGGGAPRWRQRLSWAAGALTALVLLGWLAPAIALMVVAVASVAWVAVSPKRAFVVLACLLPLHTVTMAFLYGIVGVPEGIMRLMAAWKELVVLAAFVATLVRALTGRGSGASVHWLDLVVGALGALILADLIAREAFVGTSVPFVGQLYGVRDSGIFLLLYYVGRSNAQEMTTEGILRMLFIIGVLTAVLAIIERLFVPPQVVAAVGLATYMKDFLNVGLYLTEDGLPQNFFSDIGGTRFRRAGSIWLSSQAFALSFLLIMPAATILLLRRDRRAHVLRWLGYAVSWIGLLLSITRGPIFATVVAVCVVAWYMHRRWAILGMIAAFVGAVAIAIVAVPALGTWLIDTLFFRTSSSTGHIGDWTSGLISLFENPMGTGLATADATGDRFGAQHVTSDNLYLKYGVELGFLGLGLLLTIFAGVAGSAWTAIRSKIASVEQRHFGIWVLAATIGVVISGMTVTIFGDQFVAYLYLWLAGAMVTVAQASRSPSSSRA